MADEKRYKILEQTTSGWFLIDDDAQELTKDECNVRIGKYIDGGQNPSVIKAVLQNDPRYPTLKPRPGYVPGQIPPPT